MESAMLYEHQGNVSNITWSADGLGAVTDLFVRAIKNFNGNPVGPDADPSLWTEADYDTYAPLAGVAPVETGERDQEGRIRMVSGPYQLVGNGTNSNQIAGIALCSNDATLSKANTFVYGKLKTPRTVGPGSPPFTFLIDVGHKMAFEAMVVEEV